MNYSAIRSMSEQIAETVWQDPYLRQRLKEAQWNGIEHQIDLQQNISHKLSKELEAMEEWDRDAKPSDVVNMLMRHFDNITDPSRVVLIRDELMASTSR